MNIETVFDRVPGCRDKRKAKRAAHRIVASGRDRVRRQARALGVTTASYGARRYRVTALRHFLREAFL